MSKQLSHDEEGRLHQTKDILDNNLVCRLFLSDPATALFVSDSCLPMQALEPRKVEPATCLSCVSEALMLIFLAYPALSAHSKVI